MALTDQGTGFNRPQTQQAINNFNSAFTELMNTIQRQVQDEYLNKMYNLWASSEASSYLKTFSNKINTEVLEPAKRSLTSVVNAMNNTAARFAKGGHDSWDNISAYVPTQSVNGDGAKVDINGVSGVAEQEASSLVDTLGSSALTAIDAAFDRVKDSLKTSGFMDPDGSIQQRIDNACNELSEQLHSLFNAEAKVAKQKIEETVQKYGQLRQQAVDTFGVKK